MAAITPASAAAVSLGIGIGIAASSAVAKGIQEHLTTAEGMALASAEQAVRFLTEFFARQGWIDPSQVRKARMTRHEPFLTVNTGTGRPIPLLDDLRENIPGEILVARMVEGPMDFLHSPTAIQPPKLSRVRFTRYLSRKPGQ